MLYSPGTEVVADSAVAEAPITVTPAIPATPEAPVEKKEPTLAEKIRQERLDRETRAKTEAEQTSYKKENDELKAKLAKYEKTKDNLLLDAYGFLSEAGLTKEEMFLFGENVMVALAPDKADPSLRARNLEAQYKRDQILREKKEAEQAAAAEKAKAEAEAAEGARLESEFKEALATTASTATAATHPASVDWFSGNQEEYTESLFSTARNLAQAAVQNRTQADLSPANIAKVLEDHLAKRLGKYRAAPAQPAPTSVSKPNQPPVKPSGPAIPAKEIPVTATMSDAERIARATKAAFGG